MTDTTDTATPATPQTALKTALYDLHMQLGARMVPFAGYHMPVQYPSGIKTEHLFCRSHAGLFDVSHMGQIVLSGPNLALELEKLIPVDLQALAIHQQTYGLFTNEQGGILDDLIITRWPTTEAGHEQFFLVVNAGCKHQDIAHLRANLSADIEIEQLHNWGLLALQGPKASEVIVDVLGSSGTAPTDLTFMNGCRAEFNGEAVYVTRSGYTGEDGFEISVSAQSAAMLAKSLLDFDSVEAIGLGARDSLRLEAGLCLYGHDMNQSISPIEAGLGWSISKSRRLSGDKEAGFFGAETILQQMRDGATKKRVGLNIEGRAPVREGAIIESADGRQIGLVTSGGFGPSCERPVAMGYVDADYAQVGTAVQAIVRDKPRPASICKMPFVTANYFRG